MPPPAWPAQSHHSHTAPHRAVTCATVPTGHRIQQIFFTDHKIFLITWWILRVFLVRQWIICFKKYLLVSENICRVASSNPSATSTGLVAAGAVLWLAGRGHVTAGTAPPLASTGRWAWLLLAGGMVRLHAAKYCHRLVAVLQPHHRRCSAQNIKSRVSNFLISKLQMSWTVL